jgi:hypothetical protein
MLQAADSIAAYSDSGVPFDEDFAESISKPLPKWYLDSKTERENIIREVEKNRERIIQEFKAKYEITDELKAQELQERWTKIESRARKSNNWFDVVKKKFSTSSKEETEGLSSDLESDEMKLTTKEKWEKFWDEEENAFSHTWWGLLPIWANPPFGAYAKIWDKINREGGHLLLLVPGWRSTFPFFHKMAPATLLLPPGPLFLLRGAVEVPEPRWKAYVMWI